MFPGRKLSNCIHRIQEKSSIIIKVRIYIFFSTFSPSFRCQWGKIANFFLYYQIIHHQLRNLMTAIIFFSLTFSFS